MSEATLPTGGDRHVVPLTLTPVDDVPSIIEKSRERSSQHGGRAECSP